MELDKSTPERTPNLPDHKLNGGTIKRSFLTPCRRIGLGKSPSGNMKKSPLEIPINCTSGKDQRLLCQNISPVMNECKTPKTNSIYKSMGRHKINNITKSKDKQAIVCTDLVSEQSLVKEGHKLNNSKTDSMFDSVIQEIKPISQDKIETRTDNMDSEITDEQLIKLAIQIKDKQEKIKARDHQQIPNDLFTLKDSIDTWRKAAQSALKYLLKISKERGVPTTLAELIKIHSFDIELLKFLPEEDDFED